MAIGIYGAIAIGTNATQIIASNPERKGIIIRNNGGAALYIGPDANITTSNAIPLLPQESAELIGLNSTYKSAIFGISGSSVDVRYWDWT